MASELTQDFDAHVPFAFAQIPSSPLVANRTARLKRWFFIAFAESWLAVLLFRLKVRLRRAGIPFLPALCDSISRALFRVSIGNAVEVGPGLMMTHGNVVIDGHTRIGARCQINPWVTIGLSNSRKIGFSADGPVIGDDVHIGTGAKIIGPVSIGDHARIGANAVVIHDVPANSTAVGVPARIVQSAGAGVTVEGNWSGSIRQAIIDYKLRRRSLRSAFDGIERGFEAGGAVSWDAHARCREALAVLEDNTRSAEPQRTVVLAAMDQIEAALPGG